MANPEVKRKDAEALLKRLGAEIFGEKVRIDNKVACFPKGCKRVNSSLLQKMLKDLGNPHLVNN